MTVATYEQALDGLRAAYGETVRLVRSLPGEDFSAPTRCAGWSVADLLFHGMLDAQRALVALTTRADDAPDRDAVSYWRDYPPGAEASAGPHAQFVRRSAAAYATPESLVGHATSLFEAAVRAASAAESTGRIRTQGHVLTVPDFLATLVLEAVVHRLDMPTPVTTSTAAMAVTEPVLAALARTTRPHGMSPDLFALLATGRDRPDEDDRALLGPAAARMPVLG